MFLFILAILGMRNISRYTLCSYRSLLIQHFSYFHALLKAGLRRSCDFWGMSSMSTELHVFPPSHHVFFFVSPRGR